MPKDRDLEKYGKKNLIKINVSYKKWAFMAAV